MHQVIHGLPELLEAGDYPTERGPIVVVSGTVTVNFNTAAGPTSLCGRSRRVAFSRRCDPAGPGAWSVPNRVDPAQTPGLASRLAPTVPWDKHPRSVSAVPSPP